MLNNFECVKVIFRVCVMSLMYMLFIGICFIKWKLDVNFLVMIVFIMYVLFGKYGGRMFFG